MVEKFTGTGFNANALNLDFLRDQEGNPLKTPNSFLVLHNPVRQKCNDIIDQIQNILAGNIAFSTVKVGNQTIHEADITNWNTVFGNNHNHSNKNNLDTINQNLGSGNSPNFAGLTVNSNIVWHAGNDGAGSGLDADLLEGQQGSYYLNTTNITEGSKLFYTDTRALAAITGGASTIKTSNLTVSMALVSDASGKVAAHGTVSSTELGYLDGVTSNLQTQLNSKENTISAGTTSQYWRGDKTWQTINTSVVTEGTNLYYTDARARASITGGASTIVTSNLAVSMALVSDASGKVAAHGTVSSTELGYLDGATSNLQTQVNAKENTISVGTTSQYWRGDKTWQTLNTSAVAEGTNLYYTDARARASITGGASTIVTSNLAASMALISDASGKVAAHGTVSSTELGYLDGITSSIQTQLNNKATKAGYTATNKGPGWYRIASRGTVADGSSDGGRASALFTIGIAASGYYHESVSFFAGIQYTVEPTINVIDRTNLGIYVGLSKIRLVYGTTYEGVALEVYLNPTQVSYINTVAFEMIQNVVPNGWTAVNWEAGNIPAGHTSLEFDISNVKTGIKTDTIEYILSKTGAITGLTSLNVAGSLLSKTTDNFSIINQTGSNAIRLYDDGKALFASANAKDLVIQASGGANISTYGNFVPAINNSYDLGSSSYKYKNLYMAGDVQANKGNFLDDITINKATGNSSFQWQSASSTKMQMYYDVTNTQGYWQNLTSNCYMALKDDGEVLIESKSTKDIKLVAAQNVNIQTGGLSFAGTQVISSSRVGSFLNGTKIESSNVTADLLINAPTSYNTALRLQEQGATKIQVDYIAASDFGRVINAAYSQGLTLYDNGKSILSSLNSQDIELTPPSGAAVNITAGSLEMAGTTVIDSTRKGLFNGLINSSVMRTTASSTDAWYRDLANYTYNSGNISGSIIIQTNVPFSQADMVSIRLVGYDYTSTYDSLIDITIGGYAYTTNLLIREAYISIGKRKLSVRAANKTADGKLALIIGETTDVFSYPKLKVDSAMLGYNSTETAAAGWTITISNDLSAYSNLTYLHEGSAYVLKSTNSNIIPDTNNAYDIGSSSYKFKNLYMSGDIQANKGNYLDDITINKATGNPSFQWQSASSSKMQMYYDVTNTQGFWQNITSSCYVAIKNDGEVLIESKSTKDIKLVAAQNVNIQTGGLSMGGSIVLNSNRTYTPPSIADTSAANNTLYYSSTQSKLCYKDYGGTVHTFY